MQQLRVHQNPQMYDHTHIVSSWLSSSEIPPVTVIQTRVKKTELFFFFDVFVQINELIIKHGQELGID